jgi:hypothetical protein
VARRDLEAVMRSQTLLAALVIGAIWGAIWGMRPTIGNAAPAPVNGGAAGAGGGDRGGPTADPDFVRAARDDLELAGAVLPPGGPAIGAVLSAAYVAAGLDHDPGRSWIARARLGGLVPWVTVRTTRDTSWQDSQPEVGHGTTLELRATWRLDRLVFDGRELQVAAIEAARRRERRRLATRVIRAYFTWRRASDAALAAVDVRVATRLAEATAELDALTEGWFSAELARARRGGTEAGVGRDAAR